MWFEEAPLRGENLCCEEVGLNASNVISILESIVNIIGGFFFLRCRGGLMINEDKYRHFDDIYVYVFLFLRSKNYDEIGYGLGLDFLTILY